MKNTSRPQTAISFSTKKIFPSNSRNFREPIGSSRNDIKKKTGPKFEMSKATKQILKIGMTTDISTLIAIEEKINRLIFLVENVIKENESTPIIQTVLEPPIKSLQHSYPIFHKRVLHYFSTHASLQVSAKTNQVLSTASLRTPIEIFNRDWNNFCNLLDSLTTSKSPPHAQEILIKFKSVVSYLEQIRSSNEKRKHPSLSLSKCVFAIESLCNSLSQNILSLFSQPCFPNFQSDLFSSYKRDIKGFLSVLNEAFSQEFVHSGILLCDLNRIKLNIFSECNEIITSLKSGFEFPETITELTTIKNDINVEIKPIITKLSIPFTIVKPTNVGSSEIVTEGIKYADIDSFLEERELNPEEVNDFPMATQKLKESLKEYLEILGTPYDSETNLNPWNFLEQFRDIIKETKDSLDTKEQEVKNLNIQIRQLQEEKNEVLIVEQNKYDLLSQTYQKAQNELQESQNKNENSQAIIEQLHQQISQLNLEKEALVQKGDPEFLRNSLIDLSKLIYIKLHSSQIKSKNSFDGDEKNRDTETHNANNDKNNNDNENNNNNENNKNEYNNNENNNINDKNNDENNNNNENNKNEYNNNENNNINDKNNDENNNINDKNNDENNDENNNINDKNNENDNRLCFNEDIPALYYEDDQELVQNVKDLLNNYFNKKCEMCMLHESNMNDYFDHFSQIPNIPFEFNQGNENSKMHSAINQIQQYINEQSTQLQKYHDEIESSLMNLQEIISYSCETRSNSSSFTQNNVNINKQEAEVPSINQNNLVEVTKMALNIFNDVIKSKNEIKNISLQNQEQHIKVLQQIVIKINNLQGTIPPQFSSTIDEDETLSKQQLIIKKRSEAIDQINHDFRQLKAFIKSKNNEIETTNKELSNTTQQLTNFLSKLSARFNLEFSDDLAERCIQYIDKYQEPLMKQISEQKDRLQELESAISVIHFRLIAIVCQEVPSNSTENLKQIIDSISSILNRLQDEYEAKTKNEILVQQTINSFRQTLIRLDQQMIQSSGESQILNLKQPSNSELIESVQKHAAIVCAAARGDESVRIAEIEDSFALVKQYLPESLQMAPKRYIRLFCDKYREMMNEIHLLPTFDDILSKLIHIFEKGEKMEKDEVKKIIETINGYQKSLNPKFKINEINSYVKNSIFLISKLSE